MNIRDEENSLFTEWKDAMTSESFVIDGAPYPDVYAASKVRTLFILKEVNDPDEKGDYNLRERLATTPHPWWQVIATWCAGLSSANDTEQWTTLQSNGKNRTKECLAPFSFMQLKKTVGGGLADPLTLNAYAKENAEYIRRQISIYQPNVIICCGVGKIVSSEVYSAYAAPWHKTSRGVRYRYITTNKYSPETCLIDYTHPSIRAPQNIICYGLIDAFHEITNPSNI